MTTPDNIAITEKIESTPTPPLDTSNAGDGAPPQKRGRGRPRKDQSAEALQQKIDATKETKEPPKSKPKKAASERAEFNKDKLAGQIFGLHMMAAKFTGIELLAISSNEAVGLSEAIVGMAEQYEISINPKVAAGLQLLATAAMIYGPRYIQLRGMMAEAKRRAQSEEANGIPANSAG